MSEVNGEWAIRVDSYRDELDAARAHSLEVLRESRSLHTPPDANR